MSKLKELDTLLDRETRILQRKLDLLDGMTDCVRRGFYQELETLLEQASELEAESEDLAQDIGDICRALAETWGLEAEVVTLGALLESLDNPKALFLRDRRQRLLVLVEKVRESGAALGLMVEDALDINERLLAATIGDEDWLDTYAADGGVERKLDGLSFEQKA